MKGEGEARTSHKDSFVGEKGRRRGWERPNES